MYPHTIMSVACRMCMLASQFRILVVVKVSIEYKKYAIRLSQTTVSSERARCPLITHSNQCEHACLLVFCHEVALVRVK